MPSNYDFIKPRRKVDKKLLSAGFFFRPTLKTQSTTLSAPHDDNQYVHRPQLSPVAEVFSPAYAHCDYFVDRDTPAEPRSLLGYGDSSLPDATEQRLRHARSLSFLALNGEGEATHDTTFALARKLRRDESPRRREVISQRAVIQAWDNAVSSLNTAAQTPTLRQKKSFRNLRVWPLKRNSGTSSAATDLPEIYVDNRLLDTFSETASDAEQEILKDDCEYDHGVVLVDVARVVEAVRGWTITGQGRSRVLLDRR